LAADYRGVQGSKFKGSTSEQRNVDQIPFNAQFVHTEGTKDTNSIFLPLTFVFFVSFMVSYPILFWLPE